MKEVTHPQFLYQIAFEERRQDLFEVVLKFHTKLLFLGVLLMIVEKPQISTNIPLYASM